MIDDTENDDALLNRTTPELTLAGAERTFDFYIEDSWIGDEYRDDEYIEDYVEENLYCIDELSSLEETVDLGCCDVVNECTSSSKRDQSEDSDVDVSVSCHNASTRVN